MKNQYVFYAPNNPDEAILLHMRLEDEGVLSTISARPDGWYDIRIDRSQIRVARRVLSALHGPTEWVKPEIDPEISRLIRDLNAAGLRL